jgi:hypothetical protein
MRLNNRAGREEELTWICINSVGFCFSFVSFFTQPLVLYLSLFVTIYQILFSRTSVDSLELFPSLLVLSVFYYS